MTMPRKRSRTFTVEESEPVRGESQKELITRGNLADRSSSSESRRATIKKRTMAVVLTTPSNLE
jgi:hypothetical protein